MAGFVRKRFSDIVQKMITWITTYSTTLTDFNEGGTTRTLLESVAWVIDDLYEDLFTGFREMVRLFIYRLFDFQRKGAVAAGTSLQFSRALVAPADITIPIGTIAETTDGVQFSTLAVATILLGNTNSNVVAAESLTAGAHGNVLVNTVTRIVTDVAGVDTVTNTVAGTNGQDQEAEADMQVRFKKYVSNLASSTPLGLEARAETITGVLQAKIVEHATVRGYLYLYVAGPAGPPALTPVDVLAAVRTLLEGTGTSANPGYRAAGTFIDYNGVTTVSVSIVQTLYLVSGADAVATVAAVELAQTAYVNGSRIGVDAIKERLEKIALDNKDVVDITMSTPASNVAVSAGKVAKLTSITTTTATYSDLP